MTVGDLAASIRGFMDYKILNLLRFSMFHL
jgi:hypothetical protein